MHTLFLALLAIGGTVLVVQVVLGLFGVGGDMPELDLPDADITDLDAGVMDGLELLSVRSLSAAAAIYGAFGLWLVTMMPALLAAVLAAGPAVAGMVGTAWLTGLMHKAHADHSLRLEGAVGVTATVYIEVPADGQGTGVVTVPLQGRTIELRAITKESEPFPAGAEVAILSVDEQTEIVEVVPTSTLEVL